MNTIQNPSSFDRLTQLIELAKVLGTLSDIDHILSTVTQKAADFLDADDAGLLLVNPATQQTVKSIIHDQPISHPHLRYVRSLISGWIYRHKISAYIPSFRKDPHFKKVPLKDEFDYSVIGAPIRVENNIVGMLILIRTDVEFLKDDLAYLEDIVVIASPYLKDSAGIQRFFQAPLPEDTLVAKYEKLGLVGKSKKFVTLLKDIDAAANTDVRVLLEGESGTGKELIARAIHDLSTRNDKPFVAIDCGAIPANLIESELFGHVRGAFTGATFERKGLLEEANTGTLFMDEIASMPLDMQSKLMRVLQEGEIRPVGSNKIRKVNVRIIAASSTSLTTLVERGDFRRDLYYRLYVFPIRVPSLTERKKDIPGLAHFFLLNMAGQQKKDISLIHSSVLDFMKQRPWPGNIRELENFVERLVTLASRDAEKITAKMLPPDLYKEFKRMNIDDQVEMPRTSLAEHLAAVEEELIRKALADNDWNQSKAARMLSISEHKIRYKMDKLGIRNPE